MKMGDQQGVRTLNPHPSHSIAQNTQRKKGDALCDLMMAIVFSRRTNIINRLLNVFFLFSLSLALPLSLALALRYL
jgi:hypothetical protein